MTKRSQTSRTKFKISTYQALDGTYQSQYTSMSIIAKGDVLTLELTDAQYNMLRSFLNTNDYETGPVVKND